MPFWSGEKLEEEVNNCILGQYDNNNIDCAAYTLHVGPEVFITPDHYEPNPSTNTKRMLGVKEPFNIPSGQFAFLLTEEEIKISDKSIAFISMKATTKFKGLINVSGFHVDPGYEGRLIFSVFNAGPMPIKLQRGMPLFLMWLADLDRTTKKKKNGDSVTEIDLKIIDPIHGPIFSPQSISSSVKDFKDEIIEKLNIENQNIRKDLSEHKESIAQRLAKINRVIGASAVVITIVVGFSIFLLKGNVTVTVGTQETKTETSSNIPETMKPKNEIKLIETNDKKE